MRFTLRSLPLFLFIFALYPPAAAGTDIGACKYLVVIDFSADPYGIAQELRTQASAKGFAVISAVSDLQPLDALKACVMTGSWSKNSSGGQLAVRVVDAMNGGLIAEASVGAIAWWSISRTVRGGVAKIYSQLGYSGYNEDVYQQKIRREYPTRPKVATTEEEIKKSEPHNRLEGIWSDARDEYRLGVVPAPQGSNADYVAVIIRSNHPLWQSGEIKAEIRSTAAPDVFTCTYFLANKKPVGLTLSLDHDAVLRGTMPTPTGSTDLLLMRVWPTTTGDSTQEVQSKSVSSGTGFLINRAGLVATNWHVVADAKHVGVVFPGWREPASAEVAIKDVVNDLAVLRVIDPSKLVGTCLELPFQLKSSQGTVLGQHVSTIGYPLTPLLGSNPKFTEGTVSSKSGWQDDPRTFQISAQVQPGSSGSPMFDSEGNIIAIVVATLDAGRLYQAANISAQNVNYAIKSDYLLNLLGMLPDQLPGVRTTAFSPDKAVSCIAIISAW